MKLLQRIPLGAGFCQSMFQGLTETAESIPLDETSLSPHFQYNKYTDRAEGFENYGDGRTDRIANHVQVRKDKNFSFDM